MDYTQITTDEQTAMLGAIGVKDIGELFEVIPEEIRFSNTLDLPPAMSEL